MIKLKEGQKVIGEDGNTYLVEKGDLLENRKLNEDFIELAEFDKLDRTLESFMKDVKKMYDVWYKYSMDIPEEDWEEEYGFSSFKEASSEARREIMNYICMEVKNEIEKNW